jgi:hypothetical protein
MGHELWLYRSKFARQGSVMVLDEIFQKAFLSHRETLALLLLEVAKGGQAARRTSVPVQKSASFLLRMLDADF